MKDAGHSLQESRPSREKGHSKPIPSSNRSLRDLLRPLTGQRIKVVLLTGLGLVRTLLAVTKFELLLQLDTGGRLVVMKHAIEYIEALE